MTGTKGAWIGLWRWGKTFTTAPACLEFLPYEAALGWVVKPKSGDFIGRDKLVEQKEAGLTRKLIGFRIEDRGIGRHGYPIVDRSRPEGEQQIGTVTSGTTGITVGGAIGLGYVPTEVAKIDKGDAAAPEATGDYVAVKLSKGKSFYGDGTYFGVGTKFRHITTTAKNKLHPPGHCRSAVSDAAQQARQIIRVD